MASVAKKSYDLCQTFEAELLLELMFRYWKHPLADDSEFRGQLLETVAAILEEAVHGTSLIEGLSAPNMNFVAAVYYAEIRACEEPVNSPEIKEQRDAWLTNLRHCLPSCFCEPEMLD